MNSGRCHVKRDLIAPSLILILLLNTTAGSRMCIFTQALLAQAIQGVLLCQLCYRTVGLGRGGKTGEKSECCSLRHCYCQWFSKMNTPGKGFSSGYSRDRAAGSHLNRVPCLR